MSYLEQIITSIRNSQILRLFLVGALALLLLIPIVMISGLVSERRGRRDEAAAEISSKWGSTQIVTGPALILPYTVQWAETAAGGHEIIHTENRTAVFLPRRLQTTGRIDVESRSRGIFAIPVYRLSLALEGEFGPPNLKDLGINPANVMWERAQLAVGISDVRAIREQSSVTWNGNRLDFLPGVGGFVDGGDGIHAVVSASASDSGFKFSFPLALNGSVGVYLVPFAEETTVQLKSNSINPNFRGHWLPTDRTVSTDGFDSKWKISYLGRNYPQSWVSGTDVRKSIDASRFGVELTEPVDQYRMADRSVKYAILFIFLTFTFVWLVEVLARIRVHPIQYLLLGAALCVFYLLELSLSEHLSFPLAYGIACLAVIVMVAAYSRAVFRLGRRAAGVTAGIAALYGYLFVVLTNEDGALLVGSIGLFASLAGIMFVTRGIDWYAGWSSSAEVSRSTRPPDAQ